MIGFLTAVWALTGIMGLIWGVIALKTLNKRYLLYMWVFIMLMWGSSTIIKILSIN